MYFQPRNFGGISRWSAVSFILKKNKRILATIGAIGETFRPDASGLETPEPLRADSNFKKHYDFLSIIHFIIFLIFIRQL